MMNEEKKIFEEVYDEEYEYVSEYDVAEENGYYIGDDGNWIPMDEEMEDALYEARQYLAWANGLKRIYANGKPTPVSQECWPAMIAEWLKTKEAKKPWFHICYWHGLATCDYVETIRAALERRSFEYDEEEVEWGESEIWLDSPMKIILDDQTEGREDEILNAISIIDGVPYRDGLPAPVYSKYIIEELEEYSWIAGAKTGIKTVNINENGELQFESKNCQTKPLENVVENEDEELPF